MFSQTNEYALRVITYLAYHPNQACKNADIAKATLVPPGYLYKVLQTLDRAGLVHGKRGMNGGFMLARPAEQISVLDVMGAVDPLPRVLGCPLHVQAHCNNLCALHVRIERALNLVEGVFQNATIAELLSGNCGPRPLAEGTNGKPVTRK